MLIRYFFIWFFLITIFALSCVNSNDYSDYKIGSFLTIEELQKANQIIPLDKGTLLLSSILRNESMTERHLLYYDSLNKLQSITYFPCRKVRELSDTEIIGKEFNNAHRKGKYRNDLILNYQVILEKNETNQSIGKISNKLITRMKINREQLKLYILESKDRNAGFSLNPTKTIKRTRIKFNKPDTISVFLKDVVFRYRSGIISMDKITSNQKLVSDEMVVNELNILDSLYKSILTRFAPH